MVLGRPANAGRRKPIDPSARAVIDFLREGSLPARAKRASRESGFLRGFGEPTGLRGAPSDGFKLAFLVAVIRTERSCSIRTLSVYGDGIHGGTRIIHRYTRRGL